MGELLLEVIELAEIGDALHKRRPLVNVHEAVLRESNAVCKKHQPLRSAGRRIWLSHCGLIVVVLGHQFGPDSPSVIGIDLIEGWG